jgi:hypothetical protein
MAHALASCGIFQRGPVRSPNEAHEPMNDLDDSF